MSQSTSDNPQIARLKEIDAEIQLLGKTEAALGWDQQTYMPEAAVEERSEQLALLSTLVHLRETSDEVGELLGKLGASDENPLGSADLPETDRALVRAFYRDHTRLTRIPGELVNRITKARSVAQSVWEQARAENDFPKFAPRLQEVLDLTLEIAECVGYDEHPYDALLDQYEPGMSTADVARVFAELREGLVPLVAAIAEAKQVNDRVLSRDFPEAGQERFGHEVLDAIGFEKKRGRLDRSAHPFTTNLGFDDIRLTTRYNAAYFPTALFGTIHEAGHGMYEQGFSQELRKSRLADGTSLGIHESMSRFWENIVGRSRNFWEHFYPRFKEIFPDQTADIELDEFYRAVNKVEPSFIRVEADEVTYSLHIILRFELEQRLADRSLAVSDLPEAWNDAFENMLGIRPDTDVDGVLQDIHWSFGLIGYFPTYALGNVYGLQFVGAMKRDLTNFDELVRRGEFAPIKGWLGDKIHRHGRAKLPMELCREITGADLSANHFLSYLREKYREVYSLTSI